MAMFRKKNALSGFSNSGRSFVSESLQIEGDLHSTGAIDLAGLINGNVYVDELNILDTGSVKGNFHARRLEIDGHVAGQITADTVYLGANAVIKGDLVFNVSLKTEEGADLDGYIKKTAVKDKVLEEELKEIEESSKKPEFGKPILVKADSKKTAV